MNEDGSLTHRELYWRDHYTWILEQGYRLRSRYDPNWTPSWGKDKKEMDAAEDAWNWGVETTMNDAFQVTDERHVILKRISIRESPEEVKILKYFSQKELASNPKNHCIPLLNVLRPPDDLGHEIVVLPLLREYDEPKFETVGEILAFLRQVLEGFAFLHEHNVAHRDVKGDNILMDHTALGLPDFHFCLPSKSSDGLTEIRAKYKRTQSWPTYYIIDFGFSLQYSSNNSPPLVLPLPASDPSLPELDTPSVLCNPFLSDVYYVGNWIRQEVLDGYPLNSLRPGYVGFEFLRPLVEEMRQRIPTERPTMGQALGRLDAIVKDLPVAKLRSPADKKSDRYSTFSLVKKTFAHWKRRFVYIVQKKPPIPPSTTKVVPPSSSISQQLPKTTKPAASSGATDAASFTTANESPENAVEADDSRELQSNGLAEANSSCAPGGPPSTIPESHPISSLATTPEGSPPDDQEPTASATQRPLSPANVPLPATPSSPTF